MLTKYDDIEYDPKKTDCFIFKKRDMNMKDFKTFFSPLEQSCIYKTRKHMILLFQSLKFKQTL